MVIGCSVSEEAITVRIKVEMAYKFYVAAVDVWRQQVKRLLVAVKDTFSRSQVRKERVQEVELRVRMEGFEAFLRIIRAYYRGP